MNAAASSPFRIEGPRIIVALDCPDSRTALALAGRLDSRHCRLKVGKELFTRAGPEVVARLTAAGFDVFLDLKYHDIPNTVAQACTAAADLGVWMMNVHTLGGRRMLEAARDALAGHGERPFLVGVTVLTSVGADELAEVGLNGGPEENVLRLARLARAAGLDGVVCAPAEAARLRAEFGPRFLLVTPGIRPVGSGRDDQRRIMTPAQALQAGASYLVVGRPVTQAPDPIAALAAIQTEIDALT
ncbi:MAG: orotidine 5'-phosphate decarboxylase [Chromatiales bacterium 21-64-14]|nr:MAG: orotidine 5'-phosphate decarboxylase [Chromatiales bacterium 21-64-14]HQU15386.1 orotidine-5'-phosphate decarboxylase [Gammaproteobacteria bacterium]